MSGELHVSAFLSTQVTTTLCNLNFNFTKQIGGFAKPVVAALPSPSHLTGSRGGRPFERPRMAACSALALAPTYQRQTDDDTRSKNLGCMV